MTIVLDHVAVATRTLTHGWDLFGGLLGGTWVYGGDSAGFWWGQLRFRTGPKIELLTPVAGPDGAFLERFLTAHGPGAHHLNFIVPDISKTLAQIRAHGIEPVGVSVANSSWQEAFLHPRDAYGIVIQVAQQSGPAPALAPPGELPEPGAPTDFALIEHVVDDLDGAIALFTQVLAAQVTAPPGTADASAADLTWPNGARLRLVRSAAPPARPATPASPGAPLSSRARTSGRLACLRFTRPGAEFGAPELSQAAGLSRHLGISLDLRG